MHTNLVKTNLFICLSERYLQKERDKNVPYMDLLSTFSQCSQLYQTEAPYRSFNQVASPQAPMILSVLSYHVKSQHSEVGLLLNPGSWMWVLGTLRDILTVTTIFSLMTSSSVFVTSDFKAPHQGVRIQKIVLILGIPHQVVHQHSHYFIISKY